MTKKKGGVQTAVSQWAYQNRRAGSRAADILRAIEETEKVLDSVKIKKR